MDGGVAGEAEGHDIADNHAGEEVLEVVADELIEGEESDGVPIELDFEEAGEDIGDFDTSEEVLGRVGRADEDTEVFREVGDEGELVAGIDREWGEDGEDIFSVPFVGFGAFGIFELIVEEDEDAGIRELGEGEVEPDAGLLGLQLFDHVSELGEGLARSAAVGGGGLDTAEDVAFEQAHALHEELIEVACEDGEELDALEQREGLVGSLGKDAAVELKPGEVTVEEAGFDCCLWCVVSHGCGRLVSVCVFVRSGGFAESAGGGE